MELLCVGRSDNGKHPRSTAEALAGTNATSATYSFTFDVKPTDAQLRRLSKLNWIREADIMYGQLRVVLLVRIMPEDIRRLQKVSFGRKLVELMG